MEIGESRISLISLGMSNHTCNMLTYEVSESMKWTVGSSRQTERTDPAKGSLRRYTGLVANFLEGNVDKFAATAIGGATFSAANVGQNMQCYSCCLGRLDVVAVEMQGLLDRYNGKLIRNSSDSYSLSLEFEGRLSKLWVDFKIGASYPWLPLEVEMDLSEGSVDMDVDRICKALKKNAKLGFGSLSRACDIVSAYVT